MTRPTEVLFPGRRSRRGGYPDVTIFSRPSCQDSAATLDQQQAPAIHEEPPGQPSGETETTAQGM